jgi:hypothetical protein
VLGTPPQVVEADISLLSCITVIAVATSHAGDQREVMAVAALRAARAHTLHKVVADGAAAVLVGRGGRGAVVDLRKIGTVMAWYV